MIIVLIGPPGIGKGTHGSYISEKYKIPKISTGDLVRKEIDNETETGKKAKEFTSKGQLLPDDMILELLRKRIVQEDCLKGFVLDGYPRNMNQAKTLNEIVSIDLVLNFVASEKTIIERISGRLTCRKCGAIYHTRFNPPKVSGKCDKCGGELYVRDDQKPEVVKERLRVYEEQTKPLVEFYRAKGILIDVNAEGEIEEVRRRLDNILEKRFKG